ncbi:Hpt domain-containing protein [Psychromonas sp.]|uniref:hybrid sensor histidine kinase/response regulator n=1 Tax=Psychromonas sp. TaxID=1884585 RepID=UPI003562FFF9
MFDKLTGKWSTQLRIVIGQISIIVSATLFAVFLGIFPNEENVQRQGRQALAESIAAKGSLFITHDDSNKMEAVLQFVVARNPELLSAGIRRGDTLLFATANDHVRHWHALEADLANNSQVVVPLWSGDNRWGQIELRFSPIVPPGIWGFFSNPVLQFTVFISVLCLAAFFLYLGRMLKQLDPSQAVPDRVRTALDTMAESLIILDKKMQIVLVNQSFSSLIDRPAEEMIGQHINGFNWQRAPEQTDDISDPWVHAMDAGEVVLNRMMKLETDENHSRTFMINCSPVLLPGGKVGGVMVSLDDVTELEQKEIELRLAKNEAEQANRAKSDFLANMSHEIRTPMNAILGFTQLIMRDKSHLQNSHMSYLNTISNSGEHLLGLINDILDLSKVESGKLEIEIIDCKPVNLIHQIVQVMRVKADEKGLAFNFVAKSSLPEVIKSDSGKIRQILTNLAGNAIKFTESGSVTILARMSADNEERLIIEVTDTGLGMTEEQAASVFDAFIQADSSITRKFGGTGLGLSISKRFANAMGGDIEVTSKKGEGSTFSLILDIEIADNTNWLTIEDVNSLVIIDDEKKADNWLFPAAKVLVVDDGNENRELVRLVLEEQGLEIVTAVHGKDGLEKLHENNFDLVLMDVQMPVMDGYAAVELMRKQGMLKPIVALTAHAMKGIEQRCLQAGYSHYMTKPIEINKLLSLTAELLGAKPQTASIEIATGDDLATGAALESERKVNKQQVLISDLIKDRPQFKPLVKRFIEKLNEQLDEVKGAVDSKEIQAIASFAHWLKGSGGSVGLHAFTAPAIKLETAAKNAELEIIKALIENLASLAKQAELGLSTDFESADFEPGPRNEPQKITAGSADTLCSELLSKGPQYRAIVQKFVEKLPSKLKQMDVALSQRNMSQLAELSHWLKGSGGSVGFSAFVDPAKKLEAAAVDGDLDSADIYLTDIITLSNRIDGVKPSDNIRKSPPVNGGEKIENSNEDSMDNMDSEDQKDCYSPAIYSSLLQANPKYRPLVEKLHHKLLSVEKEMQVQFDSGDFKTLQDSAHWVKGSAGSVGFNEFTVVAAKLESACQGNDVKMAGKSLQKIRQMIKNIDLGAE